MRDFDQSLMDGPKRGRRRERSEGKNDESKLLFSSLLSWLKSLNLSI
jgi:hypothetical protein